MVNKPASIQCISMLWSADLCGLMECRSLAQSGSFQLHSEDKHTKLWLPPRQAQTPMTLLTQTGCFHSCNNAASQRDNYKAEHECGIELLLPPRVSQAPLFSQRQTRRLGAEKLCGRSAVVGGLSIAPTLAPQRSVLLTCEQMWLSLNYTVDLMT